MKNQYDYIIIGAGSAGCVLANRLSANPDATVLLLEAGRPDKKLEMSVPAAFPKLFKTVYDWAFYTEPQRCAKNRIMYWPRGKTLGGSSSINAMIYIRGNAYDYDRWAAQGNVGWAYQDVLPYFKKLETHPLGPSDYHGAAGPLHIEVRRYTNPLTNAFVAAAEQAGFRPNPDFSGAFQEGVGAFHVTCRGGRRHSAATAFLKPVLSRPNLTVKTGAHVHKIAMSKARAQGVMYRDTRRTSAALTHVTAGTAVVLAAGAVQSPQLLLLSGIGAAADLRDKGIEPVLDLPGVGQHLWDHLALPVIYKAKQPVSLDSAETGLNLGRYLLTRRGPLASNIAEAGAFRRVAAAAPAPDLQYHFGPAYFANHGFTSRAGHHFSIGPTLIAPQSRGYINLHTADPEAPPKIEPRYLSAVQDVAVLREGIRLARDIAAQAALEPHRGEEVLSGAGLTSDAALNDYVREQAETLYHPAGSCRMGQDDLAVVDASLRVHGTPNLYVVDASVMPDVVRGNTNVPTMMIAEKAAALLLAL